jgi:hypothetical protein
LKSREQFVQAEGQRVFNQEMVTAIARHFPLLLIGPLLVALLVYLLAQTIPVEYKSISVLRIDRTAARSLETLVTTPGVANEVLSKYAGTGDSPESRARFLSRRLRLIDPEPVTDFPGERLFRLEVTHADPRIAQTIASDVIEAWLQSPQGSARAALEADMERNKLAMASISNLITQLEGFASKLPELDAQSADDMAHMISGLNNRQAQYRATTEWEKNRLQGVSRDVVIRPPHLPHDPIPSMAKALALLYGVAAVPVFFAVIVLGRYLAPGRSVYELISRKLRRGA